MCACIICTNLYVQGSFSSRMSIRGVGSPPNALLVLNTLKVKLTSGGTPVWTSVDMFGGFYPIFSAGFTPFFRLVLPHLFGWFYPIFSAGFTPFFRLVLPHFFGWFYLIFDPQLECITYFRRIQIWAPFIVGFWYFCPSVQMISSFWVPFLLSRWTSLPKFGRVPRGGGGCIVVYKGRPGGSRITSINIPNQWDAIEILAI